MEEEKRKKKNRKKKNKQSKTVEDGVAGVEETATTDQNLVNNGKDDHGQLSEATDEPSTDVDLNGLPPNGKECVSMQPVQVGDGKRQGLEREAMSEEIVRKLRNENDMLTKKEAISAEVIKKLKEENEVYIQKEGISLETIRKFKEENDMHIQKEVISEETIRKLKEENDMHIQKEAISEETIKKLKEENMMHIKKEFSLEETINQLQTEIELKAKEQGILEMKIVQLQNEKDSLLQIKAGLEEKTNQLLNEKSVLNLKRESLEERINHMESDMCFSVEKEKSTEEALSNLNGDIHRLQLQVSELEENRNNLFLENQQLKENLSDLQSTVQILEKNSSSSVLPNDYASENEVLKSHIEAASMLVEKLVAENAELVEKVNELYMKLDQQSEVKLSGTTGTDESTEFAKPDNVALPTPESLEIKPMSVQELIRLDEPPISVKDNSDAIDAKNVTGFISSSSLASDDSGEIVQIPLDDNEVQIPELELQAAQNVDNDEVPITDAPLIGAPFRLISFVAKYVSGADLVNQSS
ncbi:myosin-9 isoform X1 [Senna tora]|uniref:Myosin-9 isoform X1 n=1 Tax=Senna tora TaxID=362788 RepID=A0A835CK14_9FABA|nr:myosin-9 isoform X1 [Senna tora]